MELLIKAKDIRVEYNGRDVLDIGELELHAYDRIGLVGGNERNRLERAVEEKRKQARKFDQKAKGVAKKSSSKSGGRLAHQKTMGSKQKVLELKLVSDWESGCCLIKPLFKFILGQRWR